MNYADLPLQQRIDMAADYALVLVTDYVTEDEIVGELANMFSLSEKEALLAYSKTRTKHRQQFNKRQNETIWKALASVFICGICSIFYLAAGEEVGWPALLLGGIFLVGAFGAIGAAIEKLIERVFFTPGMIQERLEKNRYSDSKRKDWSVELFTAALFFAFFAGVVYFKKPGIEELKGTTIIHGVKLKRPVETTKKGDGYQFQFEQFRNQFHLKSSYLDFVNYNFSPQLLQPGDTLSIELRNKEYFGKLQLPQNDEVENVEMNNILLHSKPLINWQARNVANQQQYEEIFLIALAVFVLSLVVMFIRHKMAAYQLGR